MPETKEPSRVIYRFGEFLLDTGARTVSRGTEPLTITAKVFDTLLLLLDRAGETVEKEEFFRRVWRGSAVDDANLTQTIFVLRKLLGDREQRIILTLSGRGYTFAAPVERVEAPTAEVVAPRRRRFLTPLMVSGVTGVILIVILAAIQFTYPRSHAPLQTVRYRVPIPESVHLTESGTFSLSPDGRTLAYLAAKSDGALGVWAQPLDSLEPRLLSGTEVLGGDPPPFWSPDSKFVAFYSGEKIKKADLNGNPPQTICSAPGIVLGGSWNRDGVIIFGRDTGGLMRVRAAGGDAVPLTKVDRARGERVHASPVFLPDGRHFLYSRLSSVPGNDGIYAGSLDVKPEDQGLKRLVSSPVLAQFVASADRTGKLLYLRDSTLLAQDFDVSRLELMGTPAPVAERVGSHWNFGFFGASANDVLIYRNSAAETAQLAWFDRHGTRSASFGEPVMLESPPALSPDGMRIALSKLDAGNVDLWVHDLARDIRQRLTFDPGLDQNPVWSHDGKHIAFASSRAGHYDLYQIAANRERAEELLYESGENKYPTSWSPDGRFLLYGTKGDVWVLPLEGAGKHTPIPLVHTQAGEGDGTFSPDGRWVAYVSDESGTAEVYIEPFSPPVSAVDSHNRPKVLVSRGAGSRPRWRADGKELFYSTPGGMLMSVALTGGATVQPGVPQALFQKPSPWYSDEAGQGDRFLVAVPVEQSASQPFTVVLNWQAGLKR